MKHVIARLLKPVLRLLIPVRNQRHPLGTHTHLRPYSCDHIGGPPAHRTGERPPRGEDSPLVRPYFLVHERQLRQERAAEARRQRVLRGALLVAAHGVHLRPCPASGSEVIA